MEKKYLKAESGICEFLCVREEKTNCFEITVIIFKAYRKFRSLIQKGFLKCRISNPIILSHFLQSSF